MEKATNTLEDLFNKSEAYAKTSFDLAKLKGLESSILIATTLISRLSVIVAFGLFVLVLNIGVAMLIGDLIGKDYFGFFIVAGFYFVSGIILHFFLSGWIKKSVGDLIILLALQKQ